MPVNWWQPVPKISKHDEGFTISHTHNDFVNPSEFGLTQKTLLNEKLDREVVGLKGCIVFFKAVANDKANDAETRAVAAGTAAEDEARLADFTAKKSCCVIL